jgi:hypothetical protein
MNHKADQLRELLLGIRDAHARGKNAVVPTKTKTLIMGKRESGFGNTVLSIFRENLSI